MTATMFTNGLIHPDREIKKEKIDEKIAQHVAKRVTESVSVLQFPPSDLILPLQEPRQPAED